MAMITDSESHTESVITDYVLCLPYCVDKLSFLVGNTLPQMGYAFYLEGPLVSILLFMYTCIYLTGYVFLSILF